MTLESLTPDLDVEALVKRMAAAFGGDAKPVRDLLALTIAHRLDPEDGRVWRSSVCAS